MGALVTTRDLSEYSNADGVVTVEGARWDGDGSLAPGDLTLQVNRAPSMIPGGHPAERRGYPRASCVIWVRLPLVSLSMAMVEPVTPVGGMVNPAQRALIHS